MEDSGSRTVKCGTHGEVERAFVCCHIVRDDLAPAGFNEFEPEPDDPDLMAWCDDCMSVYEQIGEWTDQLAEAVDIRLVCEFCFSRLRELHERAT
jgi:hypothetical protein